MGQREKGNQDNGLNSRYNGGQTDGGVIFEVFYVALDETIVERANPLERQTNGLSDEEKSEQRNVSEKEDVCVREKERRVYTRQTTTRTTTIVAPGRVLTTCSDTVVRIPSPQLHRVATASKLRASPHLPRRSLAFLLSSLIHEAISLSYRNGANERMASRFTDTIILNSVHSATSR